MNSNFPHKQPTYVEERHPFSRIPAFEDSELKLYESRAICRYLVTKHPGSLSLPTMASELGIFEQTASVEYSYFDPAVTNLAYEKLFKGCVYSILSIWTVCFSGFLF